MGEHGRNLRIPKSCIDGASERQYSQEEFNRSNHILLLREAEEEWYSRHLRFYDGAKFGRRLLLQRLVGNSSLKIGGGYSKYEILSSQSDRAIGHFNLWLDDYYRGFPNRVTTVGQPWAIGGAEVCRRFPMTDIAIIDILDREEIRQIAALPTFGQWDRLALRFQDKSLADYAAGVIADADQNTRLRILDFRNSGLTKVGLRLLSDSKSLSNLEWLGLTATLAFPVSSHSYQYETGKYDWGYGDSGPVPIYGTQYWMSFDVASAVEILLSFDQNVGLF